MTTGDEPNFRDASRAWDDAAATFDDEPDHGLRDPVVRQAWISLLARWLPPVPAAILDIGCGTGSLSLVMSELGYSVTGIDFSPEMVARAESKVSAAGEQVAFQLMDASHPQFGPQRFRGIVSRHLLWALPNPAKALGNWVDLLEPGGRLLLVEGFWKTGAGEAGLHAKQVLDLLPAGCNTNGVENLSGRPELWGRVVPDERYLVVCQRY